MIRATTDADVAAPADEVFAVITDPAQWSQWLPGRPSWPDGIPDSVARGTRFRQRLSLFGMRDTLTITVTESEPPSRFEYYAKGNYGADVRFEATVVPTTATGSRVTFSIEVVGELLRPLRLVARRGLDQLLDQSVREFRARMAVPEDCARKG